VEEEAENSENLRQYISRLEKWPEDKPPTPADLRILQRGISRAEKDKADSLAENHARRARAALDTSAYNQAIIEMTRVLRLRPLDPTPRIELARIYLQRSLERGYKRRDRQRAIRLAKTALVLNPADAKAKSFLQNYRRMNSDFSTIKNRKYILPILLLVVIAGTIAVWQRDLPSNSNTTTRNNLGALPREQTSPFEARAVDVDIAGFDGGNLETEIIQAEVGRRNDDSFVKILGKISISKEYVEAMRLLVRGKDASGNTQFSIPWTVLDNDSPLMFPGDSTTLIFFRWLVNPETSIDKLEITPLEFELLQERPNWTWKSPVIVWDTPRPENVSIGAEIRRFEVLEAYDRLVLAMDLVLTNKGLPDISQLSLNISLGSDLPNLSHYPVTVEAPPMSRGERRVWTIAMGLPLDAVLVERDVTIRITEAKSTAPSPR